MKISVLGTEYDLLVKTEAEDKRLKGYDGYCDTSIRVCVVDAMNSDDIDAKADLPSYQKKVKRHELIHAFLYESGLDTNSWAGNEEMVDWIAMQFEKLHRAFEAADAL